MTKTIQKGLVSTIIPVYNRPKMIIEAVESVLQQSYRPIEVIIVDDGSTDNTPQTLSNLGDYNDEITILSQDNSGPGVARELGRQQAVGEFIQYLDSDDLLLPGKFEKQVSALLSKPACDVAYGKTEFRKIGEPDNKNKIALKLTGEKVESMFPLFLCSRWWSTSTPLFRRSITDAAGPWLPIINEEDWEYDSRIASLGGRLAYVDEFVSVTRSHSEHLSSDGSIDKVKLADRCLAREHIYKNALNYNGEISQNDWQFFSKSVFLLARQSADQNMDVVVKRFLRLAIQARGKTTLRQTVFTLIGRMLGWPIAARVARLFE